MANFIVQMRTLDGASYSVGYSGRWASKAAWVGDVGPSVTIALANVGSALTLCAAASLRSYGKAEFADRVSHIFEPIRLLDRAILRIANPLKEKNGVETFRIIRDDDGAYRLENEIVGELTAHMLLQIARTISGVIEHGRADMPEDIGLETLDSEEPDDSDDG